MTNLRVVTEGERRRPPKPLTVTQAARSENRRAVLVALRDVVASTIQAGCSPRDLGTLSLRLADLTREIETIDQTAAKLAEEDAEEARQRAEPDGVFDPTTV